MKLITFNIENNKILPSIKKLLESYIIKSYPIIFFVDIDNTLLVVLNTNYIPHTNYNNNILDYNLVSDSENKIIFDIIDSESVNEINFIKIISIELISLNTYEVTIIKHSSFFVLRLKFRNDIFDFFANLYKLTPYVGLFTAGNKEYAAIIYKIISVIFKIKLSFYFSVESVSPELYHLDFKIDDKIYKYDKYDRYNGKDLNRALAILQKMLLAKNKPIYTIPVLIDDNPTWCINGWVIPIKKLTSQNQDNFNDLYNKEIYYSNIKLQK